MYELIKVVAATGGVARLTEGCVGTASKRIVYPGIEQCLSITGWRSQGLIGAHVSPNVGSKAAVIGETLAYLAKVGAGVLDWYVVGNASMHFAVSHQRKAPWASEGELAFDLRARLPANSNIFLHDTYAAAQQQARNRQSATGDAAIPNADGTDESDAINIAAVRTNVGVQFVTSSAYYWQVDHSGIALNVDVRI